MAIRIDVKEYCADCFDFEADVTRPERMSYHSIGAPSDDPYVTFQSDTVIRCTHAKRCEGIKRYLEKRS